MFAGIMGMDYNEETKIISAIISREGEKVDLTIPFDLNEYPKVNDWLRKLEQEMQNTMAKLLANSLSVYAKFDFKNISEYMEWLDHYPVIFCKFLLFFLCVGSNRLYYIRHLVEHLFG